MIQLILKPRKIVDGKPQWHDRVAIDNAITFILSKAKKPGKNFLWMSLAGKIEEKCQELEYEKVMDVETEIDGKKIITGKKLNLPEIPVELSENQARQLWKEIEILVDTPSAFYSGLIKCPQCGFSVGTEKLLDTGTLSIMLQDIADQLGEKWVEGEAE